MDPMDPKVSIQMDGNDLKITIQAYSLLMKNEEDPVYKKYAGVLKQKLQTLLEQHHKQWGVIFSNREQEKKTQRLADR